MKTSDLIGAALDWAAAKCEPEMLGLYYANDEPLYLEEAPDYHQEWTPSTNWIQGGEIIEREGIEIKQGNPLYFPKGNENGDYYEPLWIAGKMHGPTPLVAAMRCYVASKLGDEIEVPEALL